MIALRVQHLVGLLVLLLVDVPQAEEGAVFGELHGERTAQGAGRARDEHDFVGDGLLRRGEDRKDDGTRESKRRTR